MRRTPHRPGFTLVELLVVMTIIFILAGLAATAGSSAISFAKRARVLAEIKQVHMGVEHYKLEYGDYPPCMGDADTTLTSSTGRAARLMRHLQKAFPRFIVSDTDGNGDYGYGELQARLTSAGFNYFPDPTVTTGAPSNLSLNTLDQAEALVFFLAGPPTPYENSTGSWQLSGTTKTYGFHSDPTNPFRNDPVGQTRSINGRSFEFVEDRLVDRDRDGWLEYIPDIKTSATIDPPYVYFDGNLYTRSPMTAAYIGTTPPDTNLTTYPQDRSYLPYPFTVGANGFAVPYSKQNLGTTVYSWVNPDTFQIVCAGFDGLYGASTFNGARRIYSTLANFDISTNAADDDNLTNFYGGELAAAVD